jgi:hypothetical protein
MQSFEELAIPATFRTAAEKELTDGEKMLWVGRPSRNPQVHPRNPALTVIGIVLIVLGLAVAVISMGVGGQLIFPFVFGGALGLIGLVFLIPLVIDPSKFCRACYVVTNRRALVVENSLWARGARAQSYLPHQLLGMERRNHPEVAGAGDLIFEYKFVLAGNNFDVQTGALLPQGAGFGRTDAPKRVPFGFFNLDQAREVEHLIRTTLLQQLEKSLDEPKPNAAGDIAAESDAEAVSTVCACGVTIEAPGSLAGQSVKCPQCSAAVSIPSPASGAKAENYREHGSVPAVLKEKALKDLDPNERVVWIGQPMPALIFVRSIAWIVGGGIGVLIALVWLFGVFAFVSAADSGANKKAVAPQQAGKTAAPPKSSAWPGVLFPIGLLCVSAGCAAVPFVRRHYAGRTCYVLTNRRAVVFAEGLFGPTRDSYPPLEVAAMRRSDSWVYSGSGDLIFRSVTIVTTSRSRTGWSQSVKTRHYGFLAVPQINDVEKIVRETLIDRFVDKLNRANYL